MFMIKIELMNCEPGLVEIYTDGACSGNPGPCAIGIVFKFGRNIKEYGEFLGVGTNNKAELTAVLRALGMLKVAEYKVKIYTDSSYVQGLLARGWKPKKNKQLVEEIQRVMSHFSRVEIVKVKAHCDVKYNQRADEIARMSVKKRGIYVKRKYLKEGE